MTTKEKKYSYDQCGYRDYNAAFSIYGIIAQEFERQIGRWQLNVLRNQWPERRDTPQPDKALVELVEKFGLAESDNPELREAAAKLLTRYKPVKMKGMLIQFDDATPHPEDVHSYRHYDLLIFGDGNYVAVLTRKSWTALTVDKCVLDGDGEPEYNDGEECVIRRDVQGDPYESGTTPWCVRGYHDSCWRESVQSFFTETPHLGSLSGPFGWYKDFEVVEEDEVWKALRNRNGLKPWHFDEDHNFIGEEAD